MIAILGQIEDVGKDFISRLDRVPKQLEHAAGHFRMPDDIVRLA